MLTLLQGCGGGATSAPPAAPITVAIAPATVALQAGGSQQFSAVVTNAANPAVVWKVNDVPGGAVATGTITATGLYQAPDLVPTGRVQVSAQSQIDPAQSASAGVALSYPAVVLATVVPDQGTLGTASLPIALQGQGFTAVTQVTLNGTALPAHFVSGTQMTTVVPATLLAQAGRETLAAANPGNATPGSALLTVTNPRPVVLPLSSGTVVAGTAASLTLVGQNFVPGASVLLGETAYPANVISSSALTTAFPALGTGDYPLRVVNPAPNNGPSATVLLHVGEPTATTYPAPAITGMSPVDAVAGAGDQLVQLTGTGFVARSAVTANGVALRSTFVSATQLKTILPAADLATAGALTLVVTNPTPGGGPSGAQTFTVENPLPALLALDPATVLAGSAERTLTVNGTNFVATSTATINGSPRPVTLAGASALTLVLTASDLATAGTVAVVVQNPQPGGGSSAALTLTVANPLPGLTAASPGTVTVGATAATLTLSGTNFVAGSSATVNGAARAVTYVSPTQLGLALTSSDLATAGSLAVVVANPAPGGGASTALTVTVSNPAPTLSLLVPGAVTAGTAQTLLLNGSGFVANSSVTVNGTPKSAAYVSPTQLSLPLTTTDLAGAGTLSIAVSNPAPGGGVSPALSLSVNNPQPGLTSLTPGTVTVGTAGNFSLTGSNFIPGTTVSFNGLARNAAFVSSTQLSLALPSSDLATAGSYPVTVSNPAPGGGVSGILTLQVVDPVPTLNGLSPATVLVGTPAPTVTLSGSNFLPTSTVSVNGVGHPATYISPTQISTVLTADDLALAGSLTVFISNPAPGGGASAGLFLQVNNPAPILNAVVPGSLTAGAAAQTVTVTGVNFLAASTATVNGAARATTYSSATQFGVALTSADLATAGTLSLVVTNPAPGGGTSGSAVLTVNNPIPTLTGLGTGTIVAGAAAQSVTLTGANFVASSTATVNGAARTVTYVSATQLGLAVTAADLASGGALQVVVINPAPGGGASAALSLSVVNPAPALSSLSPAALTAGGAPQSLTLAGSGFVPGSTATFNGSARSVTYVGPTQLSLALTSADLATSGSFPVVVSNPAPGGGTSTAVALNVTNPVPTLSGVSPTTLLAGAAAQSLTLNGTNFVAVSSVTVNGNPRSVTYVSPTQLGVALTAADLASAGSLPIAVTNPAPGGGTAGGVSLQINNPVPTVTTLSPASALAGAAAQTVTVTGVNFLAASTATVNGAARATTYSSATQIGVALTAADLATAGTLSLVVTNPAPGGGSATLAFSVTNPIPTLTGASPAGLNAGAAAQAVALTGSNFTAGATVSFSGSPRTVQFVSATQINVTLTAADLATGGSFPLVVSNPAPGGGASNSLAFVVNNPTPVVSGQSSITAGAQAQSVTLTGTNFLVSSAVTFNGAARTVTYVSPTQLAVALTAPDLAVGGVVPVIVTNPAPGGGASPAFSLTINNPVPSVSGLSPSALVADGTAQSLTVSGANFLPSSTVMINGAQKTVTYVSATQLTVAFPAVAFAAGGNLALTVTNPAPGGGASPAVTLTVNNPSPTVVSLAPAAVNAGAAGQNVALYGTHFLPTSTVTFSGAPRTTSFINATQLNVALSAADLATGGLYPLVVNNPLPRGGTSAPVSLAVNNPLPLARAVNPATVTAGTAAPTVTIIGGNFLISSTASFNGTNRSVTFDSPTRLTLALTSADVSVGGVFPIVISNPAPGGGSATGLALTVANPAPTLASITPATLAADAAPQTLLVTGGGFVNGAQVNLNGIAHATTFVDAQNLSVLLNTGDLATVGSLTVTVTNPAPGGGTSNSTLLAVHLAVSVSPLSPQVALAGQLNFTAAVVPAATGPAVTWSLQETNGGTITATGLYTAPSVPGTYHVVATSIADPSQTAAASVQVVPGTFTAAGSLLVGRFNHSQLLLASGQVLLTAGDNASSGLSTAASELFNLTPPGFTATGSLQTDRDQAAAVLLADGRALVAGGNSSSAGSLVSAELFSPRTGSFASTGALTHARVGAFALLQANGQVLLAGGADPSASFAPLASSEVFDPVQGTFTATGALQTARAHAAGVMLPDGRTLLIGGQSTGNVVLSSAEIYDSNTGSWTAAAPLTTPRMDATATLLPNGKVLVVGGRNAAGTALNTAELFDPTAGTFTLLSATLQTARYGATVALLNGGQVLIAGGNDGAAALSCAEIFDPATATFTPTGSMASPRQFAQATLLLSGQVLIAGGKDGAATAELYTAAGPAPTSPTPILKGLSPGSIFQAQLSSGITLLVQGSSFVPGAAVQLNGRPIPTTFISSTLLSITVPLNTLLGNYVVSVSNPGAAAPSQGLILSVVSLLFG